MFAWRWFLTEAAMLSGQRSFVTSKGHHIPPYWMLDSCKQRQFSSLVLPISCRFARRMEPIQPFLFEPKYQENESASEGESSSSGDEEMVLDDTVVVRSPTEGRSEKPAGEWCQCGQCSNAHLTDVMCLCCYEWTLLESRLDNGLQCITEHPDFPILCLNPVVLLSMWPYVMAFKRMRGPIPLSLNNR